MVHVDCFICIKEPNLNDYVKKPILYCPFNSIDSSCYVACFVLKCIVY